MNLLTYNRYFLYETVLSNSIQQLLLVITNGRQEVHARKLTSVCKSGITHWKKSWKLNHRRAVTQIGWN